MPPCAQQHRKRQDRRGFNGGKWAWSKLENFARMHAFAPTPSSYACEITLIHATTTTFQACYFRVTLLPNQVI